RISKGEQVLLSTVHFAEIANLLEDWMALSEARTILFALATMENIRILPVARTDLVEALDLATERDVGTTDALAVILMQAEATREIYSFDRDYDRFNEIRRVGA
ncbi:MAG: type II toxin-antitoxin system VapC family toxin, partial [Methanobacteriota archaeon]